MNYSIKDLRQRTKEILDIVDHGEPVTITYRGKKKAAVIPLERRAEKSDIGFGMWADRDEIGDSAEHVRHLRAGRFRHGH